MTSTDPLRKAYLSLKRRVKHALHEYQNQAITKRSIRRFLPAQPVVIDCGSHCGGDAIQMASSWRGSVVYAIEPIPEIFAKLTEAAAPFRNIHCHHLALSTQNGTVAMHKATDAGCSSSSILKPLQHLVDHPQITFNEVINVPCATLDSWCAQNQIQAVDLLWLDMQGYELAALKHGEHILKTVKAIHIEVALVESYQGNPLYPEVRQWLEARGFRVEQEQMVWNDFGNVLFVRS